MKELAKRGDYVRIPQENRVFRVCSITKGWKVVPDGWYIENDGTAVNPKFCEIYKGATSVLTTNQQRI